MKIFERFFGKEETPEEVRERIVERHIADHISEIVSNSSNIKEVTGLTGRWISIDGRNYEFAEPSPKEKEQARFCREYKVKVNVNDVTNFCEKKGLELRFLDDNKVLVDDGERACYYLIRA